MKSSFIGPALKRYSRGIGFLEPLQIFAPKTMRLLLGYSARILFSGTTSASLGVESVSSATVRTAGEKKMNTLRRKPVRGLLTKTHQGKHEGDFDQNSHHGGECRARA